MSQWISYKWLSWPPLLLLTGLLLIPLTIIFSYSLLRRDFETDGVAADFSLDAWADVLAWDTLRVLGRSLAIAAGVTGCCVALAYPSVLALARLAPRARQFFLAALVFPLLTSQLLRVYGWMNLLPLSWQGSSPAVALVLAANYFPFMLLPLWRAWERLPSNTLHAAHDLGATPWQTFWRVLWPLTRSGRWAGCALVFIPVSGEYLVPYFLGHGHVTMLGERLTQAFEQRNWPYAAALAVWLLGVMAAVFLLSLTLRPRGASEEADHA